MTKLEGCHHLDPERSLPTVPWDVQNRSVGGVRRIVDEKVTPTKGCKGLSHDFRCSRLIDQIGGNPDRLGSKLLEFGDRLLDGTRQLRVVRRYSRSTYDNYARTACAER